MPIFVVMLERLTADDRFRRVAQGIVMSKRIACTIRFYDHPIENMLWFPSTVVLDKRAGAPTRVYAAVGLYPAAEPDKSLVNECCYESALLRVLTNGVVAPSEHDAGSLIADIKTLMFWRDAIPALNRQSADCKAGCSRGECRVVDKGRGLAEGCGIYPEAVPIMRVVQQFRVTV